MEILGYIKQVFEPRSGTSAKTGNGWYRQEFLLETLEQYPKHLKFEVKSKEKVDEMNMHVGDELTVSFNIDAHEYMGKWYNDVVAWKVEKTGRVISQNTPQPITPSVTSASSASSADPFNGEPIEPFGY